MWKKLNLVSFVMTLVCIGLFILASFTPLFDFVFSFGIHPIQLIFVLTIFSFLLGLFGFIGIRDWKSALRSVATVMLTLSLTTVLIFMMIINQLMSTSNYL